MYNIKNFNLRIGLHTPSQISERETLSESRADNWREGQQTLPSALTPSLWGEVRRGRGWLQGLCSQIYMHFEQRKEMKMSFGRNLSLKSIELSSSHNNIFLAFIYGEIFRWNITNNISWKRTNKTTLNKAQEFKACSHQCLADSNVSNVITWY